MKIWPVVSNPLQMISAWTARQIQDVGSATDELEIPQRWLDAAVMGLAARLGGEFDGVPPDRMQNLEIKALAALKLADAAESDGAPLSIYPNILPYTR